MRNTMIIGIAGGSGSGKTTIAQKIKDYFEEEPEEGRFVI